MGDVQFVDSESDQDDSLQSANDQESAGTQIEDDESGSKNSCMDSKRWVLRALLSQKTSLWSGLGVVLNEILAI